MEEWRLSAELEELERALAARALPGPSADLRERVLGDVRVPLLACPAVLHPPQDTAGQASSGTRGRARWQFALAVAAGVMLWLNLSLAATRATDFGLRLHGPGESIETACRQIEQLVPELSPQEARRQAILLRAGSTLVPCPDLSSNVDLANLARRSLLDERLNERNN
jgi:hypothetical protein